MKHPYTRSERRTNAEVYRTKMRKRMLSWSIYNPQAIFKYDPRDNRMWWARKQSTGHGNRCCCNIQKISERRKRRLALDAMIEDNLKSFD